MSSPSRARITWTITDEAPALATHSLLPILQAYLADSGIDLETADISLAGRILATFPEGLDEDQRIPDELARLGSMARTSEANIIKLPNISASIPQLQDALAELKGQGYQLPDFPAEPSTEEEHALRARFATVLGSAVNPVLREGNSDRRASTAVKAHAQREPHRMMKPWPESGSKARVAHMQGGDFYGSERSCTAGSATTARIEFVPAGGSAPEVLKDGIELTEGEVVDCSALSVRALREFYASTMKSAKEEGALLSLHLKATMMKVSDPVLFGHCVSTFFEEALSKHAAALEGVGANVNNGLADVLERAGRLPEEQASAVLADIEACYASGPALAMVDSDKGITNLHVPNDVIIDASMPVVVRDGGKMWNRDGELQDTVAMIPDRSYARIYQAVVEDCQQHGQFDPATMGGVSNVGLMAKKAEEYGSHDKTFFASGEGTIRVVDAGGAVLLEQAVEEGDIFRMCQTKDVSIRDWVRLGVARARATGAPAIFWLDPERGHDACLIAKVEEYLKEHDTSGLDVRVLAPIDAMRVSLERIRKGEDTISVTGNVLRDYLTDLFPILELGTSARMLSIVPLLEGGGLFETGAGGSAPKHVQQLVKENHLRWDSLGEYCAIVPSLEHAAETAGVPRAALMARCLDEAIGEYLQQGRYPSRRCGELDNRGSTFYIALYWARALAAQGDDQELAARFAPLAEALTGAEETIVSELVECQGAPVELGGYYRPDAEACARIMRPSATFNGLIDSFGA